MCRHLAWLGAERSLAELVVDKPFGLLRQSWAPRRQRHGRVNADGFGVGWYAPAARPEPARYRRAVPMWTDASFASFAGVVTSGCVLAAVRNATVGTPIEESSTSPYTHAGLLFSHNGRVDADLALALLADRPGGPPPDSRCDSALLAALVWERVSAGAGLADAVADVVTEIGTRAAAREEDRYAGVPAAERPPPTRLNLLVTDGRRIVATTWNETLWYRVGPQGVLVASEPDDDAPTVPAPRQRPHQAGPAPLHPRPDGPAGHPGDPGRAQATVGAGAATVPGGGTDTAIPGPERRPQADPAPRTATPGPLRAEAAGTDVWVEVPNHRLLIADTREVTLSNLIT
jgi:glutamine amidotransferase